MVNTHPYSTWPLHVKLFSPDAATAWNDAAKAYPTLPLGFTSAVELEGVDGKKASTHVGSGRDGPIDVHDGLHISRRGPSIYSDKQSSRLYNQASS
jgi:structure-specific endonuclease subunit SLX1